MKSPKFGKQVRWRPWVGDNYWTGGTAGRRLLIIGESHYSGQENAIEDDRNNHCLTQEVIRWQWTSMSISYFTKIAQAVSGTPYWELDKEQFWNSVAFYNFVQDIVSVGPRVAPTEEQWNEALRVLPEVLEKLRPEYVLATGKRLWDRLPESWVQDQRLVFEGKRWETCLGYLESGSAFRATLITHPSAPASGRGLRWHPLVQSFLSLPLPPPHRARQKVRA